jgi:hypothetical protein
MVQQIDLLASQKHYIDHIAPVWDALPEERRGTFWVIDNCFQYAAQAVHYPLHLHSYENNSPDTFSDNPILVCAYGDMLYAHKINPSRPIFMMEHGTGHTFGTSAYPNGPGKRDYVSLFLAPNEYTAEKISAVRSTPVEIIGTPKLDRIVDTLNPDRLLRLEHKQPAVIAIGFHHGSKNVRPPERGSAWEHYKDVLPQLASHYDLIAYGHPLAREIHVPVYDSLGIEYVEDFTEVMRRADVLINDLSSAMYEFLVTGKPVVVLNAPWFRRDVQHGIRFWDFSDIGINVEQPQDLIRAVDLTLKEYQSYSQERAMTVYKLYPYLGVSAKRAVDAIIAYLENYA